MAETDLFMSHNWSVDENNKSNHERVSAINDALKDLGYKCWFDSEKMSGNIIDKMCSGVNNTKLVLVFVTKTYEEKVGGDNGTDCCKLEFNYALRKKKQGRMIPIIMEKRMESPADWDGTLGMALGGELAIFMSFDFDAEPQRFREGINRIKKEVDARLGKTSSEPEPEEEVTEPEPVKPDRFDSLFQHNGGMWRIGGRRIQCGMVEDIPVPLDYFNERKKRLAVFRPATGVWFIKGVGYDDWAESTGNIAIQCGMRGDVPVPGDYHGKGIISISIWRPSGGNWCIKGPGNNNWGSSSGNQVIQCGMQGDVPVHADYFNEGKLRIAVWRPSDGNWYIKGAGFNNWGNSQNNIVVQCGMRGDIPVPGDYFGDGVVRLAVWRPGDGNWFIKGKGTGHWGGTQGNVIIQCGMAGDIPIPYDFFGEGKLRIAVYRPSNGVWYIKGDGLASWGATSDNIQYQSTSFAGNKPVNIQVNA